MCNLLKDLGTMTYVLHMYDVMFKLLIKLTVGPRDGLQGGPGWP